MEQISGSTSSVNSIADDQHIINDLIGPGLTVIGSDNPIHRIVLQEQMAVAIANGDKFLGLLDTCQSRVLFVAQGPANLKASRARIQRRLYESDRLRIVSEWKKIGLGCIKQLKSQKVFSPDLRVVFLGDFDYLRSSFSQWYKDYKEALNESKDNIDPFSKSQLIRRIDKENVIKLKDFAVESGVCIVVGDDLTTNKKLSSRNGLRHSDAEIHILEKKGRKRGSDREIWFELEVLPYGTHSQTMKWKLTFDDKRKLFLPHESLVKKVSKAEARAKGELPLLENERLIIDTIWDKRPMSVVDIANQTGISRSTVDQKLKALEKPNKGERVFSFDGERGKLYVADTDKKREWIK